MIRGKTLPAIIKAFRKYQTVEMETKDIIRIVVNEINPEVNPKTIYSMLSRHLIHVEKGKWRLPLVYYVQGVNANYVKREELEREYRNLYNVRKHRERLLKEKPYAKSKKIPKSPMTEKVKFAYYLLKNLNNPELLDDIARDINPDKEYNFYFDRVESLKEFLDDIGVEMRVIEDGMFGVADKENGEEWVFQFK